MRRRERVVRRFAVFTGGWPWCWTAGQQEAWVARGGWAHSTVRLYQGSLACFLDYVCDPRYGWVAECQARVGARPAQVCHEGNTAVHVSDYEGRPERRPLSRAELQVLFDTADDMVGQAALPRRKGWLAAFRDATLFKVIYGWGLRRAEAAMPPTEGKGPEVNLIPEMDRMRVRLGTCGELADVLSAAWAAFSLLLQGGGRGPGAEPVDLRPGPPHHAVALTSSSGAGADADTRRSSAMSTHPGCPR